MICPRCGEGQIRKYSGTPKVSKATTLFCDHCYAWFLVDFKAAFVAKDLPQAEELHFSSKLTSQVKEFFPGDFNTEIQDLIRRNVCPLIEEYHAHIRRTVR